MVYIQSSREKRIVSFIQEYRTVTVDQIRAFIGGSDKLLGMIPQRHRIHKDDGIYYVGRQPDTAMIKAIPVLIHFKKAVEWHLKSDFPFYITFYMNGKTYDVTVIKSGEESMMSAAINHIHSIERVIAVVEDINSIPKLDITVPARFCTVDPVTFYMLQDGEIVKERE
jgi:hypothetical protein